ncbi:unnamed protein product [Oppiella nova]|uniref:Protein kinase domain-containing protein n=1 Tax=Oppiella nova TaxID=334625 RepID=A0A7R9M5A1_9ACAR|nr:unnamed protein product [Oppiella nova]CAG2170744.1 unnamed protein product [Oppiella nova]
MNPVKHENIYNVLFNELSQIGTGGFGTVFKARHKFDDEIYAVKRIEIMDISDEHQAKMCNELKSLVKVRSEYVVQYYNSWSDGTHLYIQMEYCSQSLRNILQIKPQVFGRQLGDPMNAYEYFISCEIFRELLQCVQYLHELSPQIIHRDLKPENILISYDPKQSIR